MTSVGLARLLALVSEEYGTEFSEDRRAVWFAAFAGVSDHSAIRGLGAFMRGPRGSYRPHPADILSATPHEPVRDRPALDWPNVSDEQRASNLSRFAAMARDLADRIRMRR